MTSVKRLNNLLFYAAKQGNLDRVKKLVAEGADFKAIDNFGLTFLHFASQGGKLDVVRYFVNQGIDVNVKANDGSTPLYFAVKKDNFI